MGNNETKNGLSSLTLDHIVFDYIHFDRKNFLVKDNNRNINTGEMCIRDRYMINIQKI